MPKIEQITEAATTGRSGSPTRTSTCNEADHDHEEDEAEEGDDDEEEEDVENQTQLTLGHQKQQSSIGHHRQRSAFRRKNATRRQRKSRSLSNSMQNGALVPLVNGSKGTSRSQIIARTSLDSTKDGSMFLNACKDGDLDKLQQFIHKGLTAVILNRRDETGTTGLNHICQRGHLKALKLLFDHDEDALIDINMGDNDGNTPLIMAAAAGNSAIIAYLIDNFGRRLNYDQRNSYGMTALMRASLLGNNRCVRILLSAGANPFLRDPGRGLAAYDWAKFCGQNDCAETIKRHLVACYGSAQPAFAAAGLGLLGIMNRTGARRGDGARNQVVAAGGRNVASFADNFIRDQLVFCENLLNIKKWKRKPSSDDKKSAPSSTKKQTKSLFRGKRNNDLSQASGSAGDVLNTITAASVLCASHLLLPPPQSNGPNDGAGIAISSSSSGSSSKSTSTNVIVIPTIILTTPDLKESQPKCS